MMWGGTRPPPQDIDNQPQADLSVRSREMNPAATFEIAPDTSRSGLILTTVEDNANTVVPFWSPARRISFRSHPDTQRLRTPRYLRLDATLDGCHGRGIELVDDVPVVRTNHLASLNCRNLVN
jgi:hypothetical protein